MPDVSVSNTSAISLRDRNETVIDLFSRSARGHADRVALRFGESLTTYRTLAARIESLASLLAGYGINSGDRVGIFFLNHPDFVVSFFAVLRLGAVVVPINPLLKSEEIDHILGDSGALAVITHESLMAELRPCLAGKTAFVFCYEQAFDPARSVEKAVPVRAASLVEDFPVEHLPDGPGPEDLALIVYTSGTTGKPKGAMLSHGNLMAANTMKSSRLELYPGDCLLAVLPLCHIYGMVVVLVGTLLEGGAIAIMQSFDARGALGEIERHRVTVLPAVPAMFRFMTMEIEKSSFDLSSLRFGVVGGSSIPPELVERVQKAFACPILEGYAMTESACVATLTPLSAGAQKIGSAGPAIKGVEVAVLGPDLEPLGRGSANVGQVAVRGKNVMLGYYNLPEATASTFHRGFFLTGDLGYLDEDGYLFIVGRSKELIIRGGQNIYPAEVEQVLLKMTGIADVAVVGVPDEYMGERVKAFVVPATGFSLDEDEVKEYCGAHLAPYKVPRLVEFREELPRNSTGKVLKRLLLEDPRQNP